MDWKQFKHNLVIPTLKKIGLHSEAAANLIVGTAAQESRGKYLVQLGNGPALGFFQMEPATYQDIWDNYLSYKSELEAKVLHLASIESSSNSMPPDEQQLVTNLAFACAMCRVHYLRKPQSLPDANDVAALGGYWKKHYNTHLGKGTVEEFVHNFPMEILE